MADGSLQRFETKVTSRLLQVRRTKTLALSRSAAVAPLLGDYRLLLCAATTSKTASSVRCTLPGLSSRATDFLCRLCCVCPLSDRALRLGFCRSPAESCVCLQLSARGRALCAYY